ncbi:unnamed protein product [Nesidiocoris tenuis]|uniref:Uncharacterized protein n=1 Tax=Nesidiocoris tenuis TaxID=355587 RepID=A0A6H5GC10_9HEMI|nr:unnamed protein product [Nesidiocoris tenuis]
MKNRKELQPRLFVAFQRIVQPSTPSHVPAKGHITRTAQPATAQRRERYDNRIFDGWRFEPSVGVSSRGDRVSDWLSAARPATAAKCRSAGPPAGQVPQNGAAPRSQRRQFFIVDPNPDQLTTLIKEGRYEIHRMIKIHEWSHRKLRGPCCFGKSSALVKLITKQKLKINHEVKHTL